MKHSLLDRELSQLAFNERVLAQAMDASIPLLERLRFLCITATNLDEFFEVRVAALKQRLGLGLASLDSERGPSFILKKVGERAHRLIAEQYRVLNEELIPSLEGEKIRFLRRTLWGPPVREWIEWYYATELEPILSPIGLDPAHPFPRILNKSLNFIVSLSGRDAFGREARYAVVQAPRALPRLVHLPTSLGDEVGSYDFVFLSSIIHAHVKKLFPGMEVLDCFQFRVTRDSELYLDDEDIDDLSKALRLELGARRYGASVRLEIPTHCPNEPARFLLRQFELQEDDLYRVEGPVNLGRMAAVINMVDRTDLKWPALKPSIPASLSEGNDYFAQMRRHDILLHHPYESFAPVLELLRQAARDPKVLAIKQTLYRTGPRSTVVDLLVDAATAGKEVTVIVELRARFDEAENLELAARLQEAGAHVVYGVVGYKTHAKMLLVVRREQGKLRRYVHLGTGNYHPETSRQYADYGFFTADEKIGADVHRLFMSLTGLGHSLIMEQILHSPFSLRETLLALIDVEITEARAQRKARIVMKINGLTEAGMIQALYRASAAGVKIDLIVRGMCTLRPGLDGTSENIRVRSIVGRFLEHSRVYYFYHQGKRKVYLSSADLMERNLLHRVEIAYPIKSPPLKKRILNELATFLRDNNHAWALRPDGTYVRVFPKGAIVRRSQEELLKKYSLE